MTIEYVKEKIKGDWIYESNNNKYGYFFDENYQYVGANAKNRYELSEENGAIILRCQEVVVVTQLNDEIMIWNKDGALHKFRRPELNLIHNKGK